MIKPFQAILLGLCLCLPFIEASERPAFVDYCKRLEQEIQGRKHGFLAGNVTYYVGGFHASWALAAARATLAGVVLRAWLAAGPQRTAPAPVAVAALELVLSTRLVQTAGHALCVRPLTH